MPRSGPRSGLTPSETILQRVDVEAGVGLVHQGELRLEHRHLEDLAALLLAAGESLVDRARGELPVDLEQVHLLVEPLVIGRGVQFLALAKAGLEGGADEVGDADPGDLARVLEGEEKSRPGAFVGLHPEDGLPVQQDVAAGDRVVGMPGDGLGQGRFARAVRAHEGMDFAAARR